MRLKRRLFLLGSLAAPPAYAIASRTDPVADIRRELGEGNRLGVAALDSRSGRMLASDANSRFAMASTFKVALAGAILVEVAAGRLSLSGSIAFSKADLVPYSPVVEKAIEIGHLTIAELAAAIVEVSDNTAANLLLGKIGGPAGLTRFFRRCGDRTTRLDRWEIELNSNLPGDPRDTTTPAAMVQLMRTLLVDGPFRPNFRRQLAEWMVRSSRGLDRLRAGLPKDWKVGTKAGTGGRGAMNDLAIAWPPKRPPILIASYLDAPNLTDERRAEIHRRIAARVAAAFA